MIEALSSEFEILSEVGRGGMGVVYKARQLSLDRIVAIKMLLQEFAKDEEFINRFKREAKAVAALKHPNIVDIHDIRRAMETWFIIAEFVGGGTLRDLLRRQRILSINEATRIVYEVCSALFYTHNKGIIHRDIKPDNVMFTEDGRVRVTDFGLARLVDSSFQTRTGLSFGTPRYMSPEQGSGRPTDHRTDIYALGVMYFEMVTGRVPFDADNALALVYRHVHDRPPVPSQVNPEVPQWVDRVILRCLQKEPDGRFQDCEVFGKALEESVSTPARVNWSKTGAREGQTSRTPSDAQMTTRIQNRGKPPVHKGETRTLRSIIVGTTLGLAAVGGVAFSWLNTPPKNVVIQKSQNRVTPILATATPSQAVTPTEPAEEDKAVAWVAEGRLLMESGSLKEARVKIESALQEDPGNVEAKGLLDELSQVEQQQEYAGIQKEILAIVELARRNNLEDAIAAAEKLLSSHPDSTEVQKTVISLKEQSDRLRQSDDLVARANDHLKNAREPQAYSDLKEALVLNPENAQAASLLQRVEKAREEKDALSQLRSQMKDAVTKGDYASAESKANLVLEVQPGDSEAENILIWVRAGNAAQEADAKALSLDELLVHVEGLLQSMKYEDLSAAAKELISEVAKSSTLNGARIGERAAELAKIGEAVPSLLRQAEDGLTQGDIPGVQTAIKSCEETLKLNPADTVAVRLLSLATKNFTVQEAALDAAISQGRKLYESSDLEGAKAQFAKALAIQPNHPEAKALAEEIKGKLDEAASRRAQGNTLFTEKKYGEARKEFEAVLKVIPGDTEAPLMIAKCDEAMGQLDKTGKVGKRRQVYGGGF